MSTPTLTIVGAVIGSAIAPGAGTAVGAAIGASLGSYVDSQILYPALFPPDAIIGRRIGEINIQSAAEGTPVLKVFGDEVRVAPQVIWLGPKKEVQRKDNVGGKGGPNQNVYSFEYFIDVALAFCEGPTGPITRIYADGRRIYSASLISLDRTESADFIVRRVPVPQTQSVPGGGGVFGSRSFTNRTTPQAVVSYRAEISIATDTADLTQFRSGTFVTITGFAFDENNGIFRVLNSFNNPDTGNSTLVLENEDVKTEPAGTIGRDSPNITQTTGTFDKRRFSSITHYTGTETQTPDATIESVEGVGGNVPGYRGISYCVIKDLALSYYGNRVPQFNVQLQPKVGSVNLKYTVGDAIGELIEESTLAGSDYDVSALTDKLYGYQVLGLTSIRDAITQLAVAYNIVVQESNAKLVFKKRTSLATKAITTSDLAAHEEETDTQRSVQISEVSSFDLSSEVSVQFIDRTARFQRGSVNVRRRDSLVENKSSFDFQLALGSFEAVEIAGRLLWNPVRNDQTVRLQLPPSYFDIEESDLITFTAYGQDFTCLATEVNQGVNGVIEIAAVVDDVADFDGDDVVGSDLDAFRDNIGVQASIIVHAVDIAPLVDSDSDKTGFYLAAANRDSSEPWKGAAIFFGENEASLDLISQSKTEATVGEVVASEATEEALDIIHGAGDTSVGKQVFQTGEWRREETSSQINPLGGFQVSNFIDLPQSESVGAVPARYTFFTAVGLNKDIDVFVRWEIQSNMNPDAEVITEAGDGTRTSAYFDQREGSPGTWRYAATVNSGSSGLYVEVVGRGNGVGSRSGNTYTGGYRTSIGAVRYVEAQTVVPVGPVGYWDRSSKFLVRLNSRTLESKTAEEVLRGANIALVGTEVIGFQNAILQSDGTYELSVLLRGLLDTKNEIDTHVRNERFILLERSTLDFYDVDPGAIGNRALIKGVAPGEVEENIREDTIVVNSNTTTMWAPGLLTAENSAATSGVPGIRLSWIRRDRKCRRIFSPQCMTGQPSESSFSSTVTQRSRIDSGLPDDQIPPDTGSATVVRLSMPISSSLATPGGQRTPVSSASIEDRNWVITILDDSGLPVRRIDVDENEYVYTNTDQALNFEPGATILISVSRRDGIRNGRAAEITTTSTL